MCGERAGERVRRELHTVADSGATRPSGQPQGARGPARVAISHGQLCMCVCVSLYACAGRGSEDDGQVAVAVEALNDARANTQVQTRLGYSFDRGPSPHPSLSMTAPWHLGRLSAPLHHRSLWSVRGAHPNMVESGYRACVLKHSDAAAERPVAHQVGDSRLTTPKSADRQP